MRRLMGRTFVAAVACLFLLVGTTTAANAGLGPEWSENDPIFEIDGRIVQVAASVPIEHSGKALHFTLIVSRDATASWSLPQGQQLPPGSTVRIIEGDSDADDVARLVVSAGKHANYPLVVSVSGTGLRAGPVERQGNARGVHVTLRLTPLPDDLDESDED